VFEVNSAYVVEDVVRKGAWTFQQDVGIMVLFCVTYRRVSNRHHIPGISNTRRRLVCSSHLRSPMRELQAPFTPPGMRRGAQGPLSELGSRVDGACSRYLIGRLFAWLYLCQLRVTDLAFSATIDTRKLPSVLHSRVM